MKDEITDAEYWSGNENAFYCLFDKDRTDAFKKAIKNTVKKGDVVVDMGSGSGILSLFALEAGAKKVYAVEFDKWMAKKLVDVFSANGFSERVSILNEDICSISLPEKVDVVMGEMVGSGLVDELQVPANNHILKYAKENVKVLLNKMELYVDLVCNNDVFFGFKMPITRYELSFDKNLNSKSFSDKILYQAVDFSKVIKNPKINKKIKIKSNKAGVVNGIRLSSKTFFYDGSSFADSFSYSFPMILPINNLKVSKNDVCLVELNYSMGESSSKLKYSIKKLNKE